MEPNFIIFPSPKCFSISHILHDIYLIPKDITQTHTLYEQGGPDQLAIYLQKQEQPTQFNINIWRDDLRQKLDNCKPHISQIEEKIYKVNSDLYVPCFFQVGYQRKMVVFFHANGEDISLSAPFLYLVSLETGYSVLALEYRGYSISEGKTSSKKVEEDAIVMMAYIERKGFKIQRAIVWGRSIGCAVALAVAAKFKQIHCLVLLSPFFSLKQIARELYGNCAGYIIEESFSIESNCQQIECPMLLIHGYKDELSCYQHSLSILASCPTYCRLKIVKEMTHTRFNFKNDFIRHILEFFDQIC